MTLHQNSEQKQVEQVPQSPTNSPLQNSILNALNRISHFGPSEGAFVEQILRNIGIENKDEIEHKEHDFFVINFSFYPKSPYFNEITKFLAFMALFGHIPFRLRYFPLLEEVDNLDTKLDKYAVLLNRFFIDNRLLKPELIQTLQFKPIIKQEIDDPNCTTGVSQLQQQPTSIPILIHHPTEIIVEQIIVLQPLSSLFFQNISDVQILSDEQTQSLNDIIFNILTNYSLKEGIESISEIDLSLIQRMLRLRHTPGAIKFALPPDPNEILLNSSRVLHCPPTQKITVAGRALTKHGVRCKWWELPQKGNEIIKNEKAELILNLLISHAQWINAHMIVHDCPMFEVRVSSGYGARWSLDKIQFRGFLEPPDEEGHEKGWIHDP
ncbi:MAG: putative RNA-binding ASCH domain protein [Streblomastix strix]|uniref:Putative RNA-binding ASCH domain protein n=1 Tax=Streblomastix strix TaxID=222440 RepID=A0A5J4V458_9EUKA|nr:MAG: putative RNA-binding ASCH domain protein [Streblomastix strix]